MQMTEDHCMPGIHQILRNLGISSSYNGFPQTAYAIQLAIDDSDRLRLITKHIYPDVASYYSTTWTAVERNIRTVVTVAWKNDPLLLEELAGAPPLTQAHQQPVPVHSFGSLGKLIPSNTPIMHQSRTEGFRLYPAFTLP